MYISTNYMTHRVVMGKFLGLFWGLLGGFFFLSYIPDLEHPILLALGIEFWYATMGGMIGMAGLWDKHPTFNFELHPWLRGGIIGTMMNLMLTCFIYDDVRTALGLFQTPISQDASGPFIIMALDGFIAGMITDVLISHFAKKNTTHEIRKKV